MTDNEKPALLLECPEHGRVVVLASSCMLDGDTYAYTCQDGHRVTSRASLQTLVLMRNSGVKTIDELVAEVIGEGIEDDRAIWRGVLA